MKPEKTHLWLGVPPAKDDQCPKTINIINEESRISYVDLTLPKIDDLKFAYYNMISCNLDSKAGEKHSYNQQNNGSGDSLLSIFSLGDGTNNAAPVEELQAQKRKKKKKKGIRR